MVSFLILMALAYALGSVSSAVVICRLLHLPDPRTQGSLNPGANNVMRIGGYKPAAMVLAADAAKGLLCILLGRLFGFQALPLVLIGMGAMLGQMFPLFFAFKGGKGVGTGLGVILGLAPLAAFGCVLVWAAVAAVTRYSSLASLSASVAALLLCVWFGSPSYLFGLMLLVVLIFVRHRENIDRLLSGTESKMSFVQPAA